MMVEEGYNTRNNYTPPPANAEQDAQQQASEQSSEPQQENHSQDEAEIANTNQLPAFLTANFEHPEHPKPVEPVIVQNWEE